MGAGAPGCPGLVRNAMLCLALLLLSGLASRVPEALDYPVTRFVPAQLGSVPVVEVVAFNLAAAYTFSGSLFLGAIWYCWFASAPEGRARLLAGTVAAFAAAAISRVLQHLLPTHPRPLHDPALHLPTDTFLDPASMNHWSGFPSDHAAAWFGLATTVFLVHRRLGLAAGAWAAVTLASRNYFGLHYPTDLVGGAALGACLVWLAQVEAVHRIVLARMQQAGRHPALFYGLGFVGSFQVATLFDGLRRLASGLGAIYHLPAL